MKKVIVVMGSDSDLSVMADAVRTLESFRVPYALRVASAHRTPEAATQLAKHAREENAGVIIAGAGKAAHLAGVLAANTTLPVIGVPIKSSTMDGLDSLLSTVQMPAGIPVATVAINGAENAALLAIQMLAIEDEDLAQALNAHRQLMAQRVAQKDEAVLERYRAMSTGQ